MAIKYKQAVLITLIIIGVINIFGNCSKKSFCQTSVYNFNIGIKAYPDIDSVYVGDTIFFEINESVVLNDLSSGSPINYSNAANLSTAIGIVELISINIYNTYANSDFKFSLITGINVPRSDTNRVREYLFYESNQRYQLKFGLIPQKSGVYKMFVGSAANVYRQGDNCGKANFIIDFKNTNQHLYLNEVSFPGVILPSGGGVYLFKVK
jgi:hypothetical protein